MNTPVSLKNELVEIFPILEAEYEEDIAEENSYEAPLTFHRVWLVFGCMASECLKNASNKELLALANIINSMVESGGEKESAVATCFLEHASQIRVGSLLKPYFSNSAKSQLR